jgi:hypothetical protein
MAKFQGGELTVLFYGYKVVEPEGAWMDDITVEEVQLLGHNISFSKLPEAAQASILALADELDFDETVD